MGWRISWEIGIIPQLHRKSVLAWPSARALKACRVPAVTILDSGSGERVAKKGRSQVWPRRWGLGLSRGQWSTRNSLPLPHQNQTNILSTRLSQTHKSSCHQADDSYCNLSLLGTRGEQLRISVSSSKGSSRKTVGRMGDNHPAGLSKREGGPEVRAQRHRRTYLWQRLCWEPPWWLRLSCGGDGGWIIY